MVRKLTSEERLSAFLEELYRATSEPNGWRMLATPLARLFDAESSLIIAQSGLSGAPELSHTANFSSAHQQAYSEHYYIQDPWRTLVLDAGVGNPVIGRDAIPDEVFINSEIYVDWLRPIDVFQFLGCYQQGANRTALVGIHRARSMKDFDRRDKARLRLVAAHYAQALAIADRLEAITSSQRVTFAALDMLDSEIGRAHV